MSPEIKILSETEFENSIANNVANGIFALLTGNTLKEDITAGLDASTLVQSIPDKVVTWDSTTTADTIYIEHLSGQIEKVNTADGTILIAISGVWEDRVTLTYTKSGVA